MSDAGSTQVADEPSMDDPMGDEDFIRHWKDRAKLLSGDAGPGEDDLVPSVSNENLYQSSAKFAQSLSKSSRTDKDEVCRLLELKLKSLKDYVQVLENTNKKQDRIIHRCFSQIDWTVAKFGGHKDAAVQVEMATSAASLTPEPSKEHSSRSTPECETEGPSTSDFGQNSGPLKTLDESGTVQTGPGDSQSESERPSLNIQVVPLDELRSKETEPFVVPTKKLLTLPTETVLYYPGLSSQVGPESSDISRKNKVRDNSYRRVLSLVPDPPPAPRVDGFHPKSPPMRPHQLKLFRLKEGVRLTWTIIPNRGCAKISHCEIMSWSESQDGWLTCGQVPVSAGKRVLTCCIKDVKPGVRYFFVVRAYDVYGRAGHWTDFKSVAILSN